jgi:hypothetical protein
MVSAYERGARKPSLATLDRLLEAAGWQLTIKIERGDESMDGNGRPTHRDIDASLGSLALEGGAVTDEVRAMLYDIADGTRTFDEVHAYLLAKHDQTGRTTTVVEPTRAR